MRSSRRGPKWGRDTLVFNLLGYSFITLFAIFCILPFELIVSASLTSEAYILKNGFSFIPGKFSLEAYKMVFKMPEAIIRAYGVTTVTTIVGTVVSLFFCAMSGYVLGRKEFPFTRFFSLYFYFTALFSGGLVPTYILMVRYLRLKDSILALIVPYLFGVFYIIIIRGFINRTIPDEIIASAKVDGANDLYIFIRIVLPLSKPILASMALFIALGYWNDFFNTMMYIQNPKLYSLQYFLHSLVARAEFLASLKQKVPDLAALPDPPTESLKNAMTIVVTGPILLLYPYLQKYFVKGITIGAVKG